MKKRLTLLAATAAAVALLVGLGLASVAAASETVVIEGKGTLYAKGAGIARLHGDGTVRIWGHGVGTVLVKGAERIRAEGHGIRRNLDNGWVLFAGWQGQIHLAGKDMTVRMRGGIIEFVAHGSGRAFLRGVGTYCVGRHCGPWTREGVVIAYSP